jgi:mono/diheme cytochrome c family protein
MGGQTRQGSFRHTGQVNQAGISGVFSIMRAKVTALLLVAMSSALAAQERVGNPGDGLAYAKDNCASCHDVGGHDVGGGAGPMQEGRAASFKEIANTPGMSALALSVWFRSPHKEMPHIQLSDVQAADLVAYITSLRDTAR